MNHEEDQPSAPLRSGRPQHLRAWLYFACYLADFASFMVVFAVGRGLAEREAEAWYLGVAGAGLSFAAGVGSLLGGVLSERFDARGVFLSGALLMALSCVGCACGDPLTWITLGLYWLLGIGLGLFYPPLVGWLNQGEDVQGPSRGVSRTLIIYCISWNLGMMCGQLASGELFATGAAWVYGVALTLAGLTILVALRAVLLVVPYRAEVVTSNKLPQERAELAASFKRLGWIANLGGMFGGSMVIHLLPKLAVEIGVPAERHGQLLASWRVVIILTYLALHLLPWWHYRFGAAVISQLLAAIGLIIVGAASQAGQLLVGLALLGQLVGYNYFSGLYYSTVGSAEQRRALAAGIHEATLAAGMAIGTLAGGWLSSAINLRLPYHLAAVVMLALLAIQAGAWWQWIGSRPQVPMD